MPRHMLCEIGPAKTAWRRGVLCMLMAFSSIDGTAQCLCHTLANEGVKLVLQNRGWKLRGIARRKSVHLVVFPA